MNWTRTMTDRHRSMKNRNGPMTDLNRPIMIDYIHCDSRIDFIHEDRMAPISKSLFRNQMSAGNLITGIRSRFS